jgi:hypothetical protein
MMYGMPKKRRTIIQIARNWKASKERAEIVNHNVDVIKKDGALEERMNIVRLLESQIVHDAYECKLTCVAHKQISAILAAEGKYE